MDHHYTSKASVINHLVRDTPRSSSSKPNSDSTAIQIHDTPTSSSLYCRRVSKRGASSNASKGRRDQGSQDEANQNQGQHGRYDYGTSQGSRNHDICHGGPDVYSMNRTHGYAVNRAAYYQQYHHPHGYHQKVSDTTSRGASQSNGRLDHPELNPAPRVMDLRHLAVDRVNGFGCGPNTDLEANDLQHGNQYGSNNSCLSNTRNYEIPDGTWSNTDSGNVNWNSSSFNPHCSVIDAVDGASIHPLHPTLLCRLAAGDGTEDAINYFSTQNVYDVRSQSTSIDGDQDEEALQQGFQQLRQKLPTLSRLEQVGEMDIITEAMARIQNLRRTIAEVSPDSGLGDDSVDMDSFQFDLSPPRSS